MTKEMNSPAKKNCTPTMAMRVANRPKFQTLERISPVKGRLITTSSPAADTRA